MAKGISLHIGVDKVDPAGYPLQPFYQGWHQVVLSEKYNPVRFDCDFQIGWEGPLQSCELDARDMFKIASRQNFRASMLKTEHATTANVTKKVRSAARSLKDGDMFFLSYAGHGAQVEDLSGDEDDGSDETWCLYDRMLLDDEMQRLYTEFAKGVRILVVADSCHSGSATRAGSRPEVDRKKTGIREVPTRTAQAIYEGNKEMYDKIQKSLKRRRRPKASRILISACQDHQLAGGGAKNGQFTAALKEAWGNGKFNGDYQDLSRMINDSLKRSYQAEVKRAAGRWVANEQHPNFVRVQGASKKAMDDFIQQRPFTI